MERHACVVRSTERERIAEQRQTENSRPNFIKTYQNFSKIRMFFIYAKNYTYNAGNSYEFL